MKKIIDMLEKDEEEMIEESMQNAYLLITKQLSFNDLFEYNGCMLPYHPKKKIDDGVFKELIEYFCMLEEYEKCAELKKTRESKKYNKNFINL
tara:strand:+ start:124 stop:402 length:279 start_codon:yes stop_codon:yes gene_type:complete